MSCKYYTKNSLPNSLDDIIIEISIMYNKVNLLSSRFLPDLSLLEIFAKVGGHFDRDMGASHACNILLALNRVHAKK